MAKIVKTQNESFKDRIHRYAHNTTETMSEIWRDHKWEVLTIISASATGAKIWHSHARRRNEWKLQNLRIYDRSLDIWWDLRRALKTEEKVKIHEAMQQGIKLGDILQELKVLKK